MGLDQIGIAFSGVLAVWLTQDKRERWRRWACIFGLLGQPFWFTRHGRRSNGDFAALRPLHLCMGQRRLDILVAPLPCGPEASGRAQTRWLTSAEAGVAQQSPPR